MTKDILELYFKDLKNNAQKKLKAWYKAFEVTGLEPLYNNEVPLQILMLYDEGDLTKDALDTMVS